MRTRIGWLALLLTAGVALAPTEVRAQGAEIGQPDPVFPVPLYHDRPETGGPFVAGEFLFWRMTNPLGNQIIAIRGILDFDGSITADLTGTIVNPISGGPPVIIPNQPKVGNFLGSGNPALVANEAKGPLSYEPGWRLTAGYRCQDGLEVDFNWLSLLEAKYAAVATLVPPGLNPGPLFTETFLFSPVYNFPNDFAGPAQKVAVGNPFAAYGIWNGASVEEIIFVQRYTEYNLNARIPIFDTDYCRVYGLVGARHVDLWERFYWRTVSEDYLGQAGQNDVAIYSNVVSNQMYGPYIGCGDECWLGHGFAVSLDLQVAGMIDFVHEIAKYERADFEIESKRSKRVYTLVPEPSAGVNLWWYPIEGVEIRLGYEVMAFFNAVSAKNPVSFDYGAPTPEYDRTFRMIDGLNFGVGFIF